MICSIDKVKSNAYKKIGEIFSETGTSKIEGKIVTITPSLKSKKVRTKAQAILMAKQKLKQVETWAGNYYGKNFSTGWGNIFTGNPTNVKVELSFPKNLEEAYKIKLD